MSYSNNKIRVLKFSNKWLGPLSYNKEHQFASSHALNIYKSKSIYTFIPKCACSTMRLTLALSNGMISDKSNFEWIHNNNSTFSASLKDLITANFTFVILRNPFLRLASTYVDKIVNKTPEINSLLKIHKNVKPDEITFNRFVKMVCEKSEIGNATLKANIHWRPQVDFLVYQNYDCYVQFELFNKKKTLIEEKSNIKIEDARNLTKHSNDRFKLIDDKNYSNTSPDEIITMRSNGLSPSLKSFHNKDTIGLISECFKEDIILYNEEFKTQCSKFD